MYEPFGIDVCTRLFEVVRGFGFSFGCGTLVVVRGVDCIDFDADCIDFGAAVAVDTRCEKGPRCGFDGREACALVDSSLAMGFGYKL